MRDRLPSLQWHEALLTNLAKGRGSVEIPVTIPADGNTVRVETISLLEDLWHDARSDRSAQAPALGATRCASGGGRASAAGVPRGGTDDGRASYSPASLPGAGAPRCAGSRSAA